MSVPAEQRAPESSLRRKTREWPLVLGLIAAAALVFASTRIEAKTPNSAVAPPSAASRADFAASINSAASAGPATTADADTPPSTTATKPKQRHAATAHKASKHSKSATAAPAASAPATAPGAGSTSSPSTPAPAKKHHHAAPQQPSGSGGGPAADPGPGKLYNVPGLSGQGTVGSVTFTVSAPSHAPVENVRWPLQVTTTSGGRNIDGTVKIDVIHQGSVVGHVATAKVKNGSYVDRIKWPDRSVGYPLTLKIAITAGGRALTFLYDVTVQK